MPVPVRNRRTIGRGWLYGSATGCGLCCSLALSLCVWNCEPTVPVDPAGCVLRIELGLGMLGVAVDALGVPLG